MSADNEICVLVTPNDKGSFEFRVAEVSESMLFHNPVPFAPWEKSAVYATREEAEAVAFEMDKECCTEYGVGFMYSRQPFDSSKVFKTFFH